jgi:hypothetical protein
MKKSFKMSLGLCAVIAVLFAPGIRGSGMAILVNNYSFEQPQANFGLGAIPTDWYSYGGTIFGGIINPVLWGLFSAVPNGDQVLFMDGRDSSGAAIWQATTITIANNTTYTLDVWVGRRSDSAGDGGTHINVPWPTGASTPEIDLMAGTTNTSTGPGTKIASLQLSDPGVGQWGDYHVTYAAGPSDPYAGQTLGIQIYRPDSTGAQANFDLVTLSSVSAVPIPTTLLLLGSGLVGLIGIRRRLKKQADL